jgi:hypothetical protein
MHEPIDARSVTRRHVLQLGAAAATLAAAGTLGVPHVRNYGPNIGHDVGGRLMAAWLDR